MAVLLGIMDRRKMPVVGHNLIDADGVELGDDCLATLCLPYVRATCVMAHTSQTSLDRPSPSLELPLP